MSLKLNTTDYILIFTIVAVIVALGVVTKVLPFGATDITSADSAAGNATKDKEIFSFTDIVGWRKGPSNATSMAVFGSDNPSEVSPCFISVEYKKGVVDEAKQQQENLTMLSDSGGFSVDELGSKPLRLQTANGEKIYNLRLLRVTKPSGQSDIMSGNGRGYLQLSHGYIEVLANCNTAEQLSLTFAALESIKVNAA